MAKPIIEALLKLRPTVAKVDATKIQKEAEKGIVPITKAYEKQTKATKETAKATGGMNTITSKSIAKMATWAVGWTVMYSIMRAVTQSIGAVIKQIGRLDDALARLQTVTFDAGEGIRNLYEVAILRKAAETRASIDDVAKGLYHLKTAGLDSQQALAGLEPIMGLMVGTVTNLDAAARLVATSFNVFRKQLQEQFSDAEAFQYITDNLTYAYTHQQVELSEVSEAMRYVGQMAGAIDLDFKTLIQTIGFLGTGMLRGCFSKDTEILTDKGFKLFKDLDKTEKVATLNPDTFELEYQKPINYIAYKYNDSMYKAKNSHMDMLLTPNHNIFSRNGAKRNKSKYEFTQPIEIFGQHRTYIRGAKWTGEEPEYFILPSVRILGGGRYWYARKTKTGKLKIKVKDWVKFLAWYLAEGCCSFYKDKNKGTSYKVKIYQNSGTKSDGIKALLEKLPFNFYLGKTKKRTPAFVINSKQLYEFLKQFGKSYQKFIPDFIKELSPRLLRIFIETYALGDGRIRNGAIEITTNSTRMRDDLQEIGLKAGYATVYYSDNSHSSSFNQNHTIWRIGFSRRTEFAFNQSKNEKDNKYNLARGEKYNLTTEEKWVDYNDFVYCVEVPKYHTLFVRRNGKTLWSGNSRSGTSLANALVMISSKSDILYQKLGIVFDPQKPIDFVNIMHQLHDIVGDTAISADMTAKIFEVFGRRGARSVLAILGRFDEWIADITTADEKLKGATKTAEEFMNKTIIGQLAMISNNIKINLYWKESADVVRSLLWGVRKWAQQQNDIKLAAWETAEIYKTLPDFLEKVTDIEIVAMFRDFIQQIEEMKKVAIGPSVFVTDEDKVKLKDTEKLFGAVYKWTVANYQELKKHPEVITKIRDAVDSAREVGGDFAENTIKLLDGWLKVAKKTEEIPENILAANLALEAQWQKIKRAGEYAVLQAKGYSELQIATKKENDLIDDMVKRLQDVTEKQLRGIIVSKELSGAEKEAAEKRLAETMELLGSQTKLRAFLRDYIKDIQDEGPVKALEKYRKKFAILGLEGSRIFDILKAGMDAFTESTESATQKIIDDYKKVANTITATSRDSIALARARGISELTAAEMAKEATQKLIDEKEKELKEFKGAAEEEKRIKQELFALGIKLKSDETKIKIAKEKEYLKAVKQVQDFAITETEHRYAKEEIALKAMEATQSEIYAQEIKRYEETEKYWKSQLDDLTEIEKETGIINATERTRLTNLRDAATRSKEIAETNKESADWLKIILSYQREDALEIAKIEASGRTRLEQLKTQKEQLKDAWWYTKERRKELEKELDYQIKLAEVEEDRLEQEREYELIAARIAAYSGDMIDQLEAQLELAIERGDAEKEIELIHQRQLELLREQEQLVSDIKSGLVSGLADLIKGTGDWADLLENISDVFLKKALNTLIDMVFQTGLLKSAMSGISGWFGMGTTAISTSAEGGVLSGGFTPIKQFAEGDIVTRPTLGIVGEGKYDEAVVPLSRGRSIPVEMKGGGEQQSVNITIPITAMDSQDVFRALSKNKNAIASLILEATKSNHPLRRQT